MSELRLAKENSMTIFILCQKRDLKTYHVKGKKKKKNLTQSISLNKPKANLYFQKS